jgi:hypothetical protein
VVKKSAVKKSAAEKSAVKKSAVKKPAVKKPAAKTSRIRIPTSATPDTTALGDRLSAKVERRSRAARRMAFVAERMGHTDIAALTSAMHDAIARSTEAQREALPADAGPIRRRAQAVSNTDRWVPIGPSVVRRGQAEGRPRVTGRVRDIAVDPTAQRAYAATGKGGVWYTENAGRSWKSVGGWVTKPGRIGGVSTDLSCGCLLVDFGATVNDDYVMVGTGETFSPSVVSMSQQTQMDFGGRGVLAGSAPVAQPDTLMPFEAETGLADLENRGIYRLARDPANSGVGQLSVTGNRVLAAATSGLWLGTRTTVAAVAQWQWVRIADLDTFVAALPLFPAPPPPPAPVPLPARARVSDVLWIPVTGSPNGRIIVALHHIGVAFSDNMGAAGSWQLVANLNRPTDKIRITGRHSLSAPVADRVYVLGSTDLIPSVAKRRDEPMLWRIPNANRSVAAGGPDAAVRVRGVPSALWGAQGEYDQAIAAERGATADRVWIAGSLVMPFAGAEWNASLYAYDVIESATTGPRLGPANGISRAEAPPTGQGASLSGLIGNGVHPDVHSIRLVTTPTGARHVWVSCDGGVYVSEAGGRVNTFQARGTGLAAIEAGFVAMHPTSSHYCALGAQDNGTQARQGDTMWEVIMEGDGGGVMFHPTASQYIVGEFTNGSWLSQPTAGFVGAIDRAVGGQVNTGDREDTASSFYSGCDAIKVSATASRMAIGTERIWITDDLGAVPKCTWRVIPANTGAAQAATDPRPGGADSAPATGVPAGALGPVIQLRWESPTRLYAVYEKGIVRHDDDGAGNWTTTMVLVPAQANAPDTTTVRITDLAPIPGTTNFYMTTLGDRAVLPTLPVDTCYYVKGGVFIKTNLRRKLDDPVTNALGPLDPAHAVFLDPDDATKSVIFVGTLAGVWRGKRAVDDTHSWDPLMNGMPVTSVADLRIWKDPGNTPGAPKLLRAATQSRGVWELKLGEDEAPRTYLRVHLRDDRRMPVTPLVDPRLAPTAPLVNVYASPDVMIRSAPRPSGAAAVPFPLAAGKSIGPSFNGSYHVWTFQTAFRFHFPAIRPDGQWTDQLAELIQQFRTTSPTFGNGRTINKATWDAVVGRTRLDATGALSVVPTDRFAVYDTPWQPAGGAPIAGTEIDLLELVQPIKPATDIWNVYAEKCVIDVLLHHRDTRAVAANDAYVALFMKQGATPAALLAEPASTFTTLHAWSGSTPVPQPAGWTRVEVSGSALHKLPTTLDAFMPRAISVEVDLTTAIGQATAMPVGTHVMFVAVCGSSAESPPPAPVGLVGASTIADLAVRWPRSALRLVQVVGPRPV